MKKTTIATEVNQFLIQKIYSLYGEYTPEKAIKDPKKIAANLPIYFFENGIGQIYVASNPNSPNNKAVSEARALAFVQNKQEFMFQHVSSTEARYEFFAVKSYYIMKALELTALSHFKISKLRKVERLYINEEFSNIFFKLRSSSESPRIEPYKHSPIGQEIAKKENLLAIFSSLEDAEVNAQSIVLLKNFVFDTTYISSSDRLDFIKLLFKKGKGFFSKPVNQELFLNDLLIKHQESDKAYRPLLQQLGYPTSQPTVAFPPPEVDVGTVSYSLERLIQLYPLKTSAQTGRNDYLNLTNKLCEHLNHYFSKNSFLGVQFVSAVTSFNKKSHIFFECAEPQNREKAQLFISECLEEGLAAYILMVNDFISASKFKEVSPEYVLHAALSHPQEGGKTNPVFDEALKVILDKKILAYQVNQIDKDSPLSVEEVNTIKLKAHKI